MAYSPLPPLGQATMANSLPVVLASNQSAVPISGTVAISGTIPISGTVAATQSGTWNITNISGTVSLPTGAATAALQTQPGVDIGDVTVNNAAGVAAVNIQDGGNSITVDGTVAATQSGTWNITNISGTVSLPTGAATAALQTQPGVDIGDVTVNNAAGAAAVNIQDGGNSITVDGTVAVSAGSAIIGKVGIDQTTPGTTNKVSIGTDGTVAINAALPAGSNIIGNIRIDQTTPGTTNGVQVNAALPTGTNTIGSVKITDGTNTASVRDTGSSDSLNVAIVDASGNQITSFGGSGGTAMTDDSAFTPGSTQITPAGGTYRSTRDAVDDNDGGAFAMTAKRAIYAALETPLADSLADDTADSLRVIVRDGAGVSCMDDSNNALRVNIIAGAGSGGTAMVDDSAFTPGTTNITPAGGTYRSTRDAVDDNDGGAFAMTAKRALYTTLETPNADSAMDDTNDCVKTSVVVALPAGSNIIGAVTQSGTWNITNVSGTISLPTGAATAALQTQPGVDIGDVTVNNASGAAAVNIQDGGNSITVDGTVTANAGSGTFAISAAALPLPSGASTAAKQPALGTAGSASADVITVQGIASMTALKVDGTGGTFPISGTVTANAGTGTFTTSDTATIVDDAAFTVATSRVMMTGATYKSTRDAVDDNDGGALAMTPKRGLYTTLETPNADSAMDDTNDCVKASIVVALPTGSNVIGAVTQSGTWNITNVSGTVSLPTGAATAAKQPALGTAGTASADVITVQGIASMTALKVDGTGGTFPVSGTVAATQSGTWNITNVSGTVSLPTGASTAAKQPALGTAGSASADVLTVQGVASMTALKVDGTGGTFPVSGTVAATQSGTWTVQPGNTANTTAWKVDGSAVTQPVSGTITANAGTGTFTTSDTATIVDDAAFTVATSRVMMTGATYKSTRDAVDDNDGGALAMTAKRGLYVSLETPLADSAMDDTNDCVKASIVVALPAGTNAIGKLAANSGVTIGAVEIAAAQTLATVTTVSTVTSVTQNADVRQATASNLNAQVVGNIAHDGVDSGNPIKVGQKAIAFGTNPTAVAAADRTDWYANRAGVPFVLGGHPNIVTIEAAYTAAQTDAAVVTISTGLKIVVTAIDFVCDNANTVSVAVRVGFGTANTPTTTGVVLTHPGVAAGSGVVRGNGSGVLGVGADNEDLRITCTVPTTGSCRVLVSYFTIES